MADGVANLFLSFIQGIERTEKKRKEKETTTGTALKEAGKQR